MQCLNVKNKEVAALLNEYTDILGSYDAAYYVLSENTGDGLDKAPNGEPSKLYNDLLSNYNNDHSMAIRAKSMVYSDSFKNWFGDWSTLLEGRNKKLNLPSRPSGLTDKWVKDNIVGFKGLSTGTKYDISYSHGRYFTVVNINGINVPFYKSSGLGGKKNVEAGKWYPFFGMSKKGWLNKTTEDEINKYYNSQVLKLIANKLDSLFNNENYGIEIINGHPIKKGKYADKAVDLNFTDGEDVINKDLTPTENHKDNTVDIINNNINKVKRNISFTTLNNKVSKVVDENGEPLVVYHHSNSPITEFSIDFDNYFSTLKGGTKKALFFTGTSIPKKGTVLDRKYKLPVYLKADRVIEKNGTKEELRNQGEDFVTTINRAAEEADAAIFHGIDDNQELNQDIYVINNPNNVKSVSNKGTFSTQDNNVYNQQSTDQTGTGRNQELASILQELYPNISIESLSDPNLRGQAQVEGYMAGKVLLNSLLENQDTLPHEYAHHYIAWFRNADIVQKGIKLFGSEESLVQAIGENSVKALKWYNRFSNWVKGLFSKKQRTLNSLTKSFLSGEILTDINNITETEVHNQEVIDKTYEKLIKATEARLRIAVHSANKDGIQTEKLQNLLSNLNKLENDKAVIEFINYMADDVTSATALLRTYRSMFNDYKNGLSASNPINADMLDLIRKGTIGFYDALVTNLKNMLEDPDVMDLYKSLGVYDSMLARINDSLSKYNDLRRHFDNLSNAVAKDNLIAEAKRYGSFTVEELQRKLDEGDSDISFWDRFLGQTQYNSNESIRLMLNSIMIAKGAVYDRKLAKGKKLLTLLSKIDKSRLPLFYERDKNGRRTGNFVRDLNFGQHEQDYMEHMLKLLDTFGVKVPSTMNFSDIPSILNPEQLKIWNKTKNEWDSKNTERKFTKEFYDLINNLSVDALAAKTQLDIDINSILNSTRDADGFAHKELLSKEKYEQYEKLMAAKRNLSNPFNMDGTAKTGKELEIAKEFQEYNKKLTKNIKYIANEDAFKKARAKAKRELTAEQFKLWEERNTVDKINEQFYEDLKKLSSVSQKSEKQEKYEYARQQLIRLYTVAGKPRIDDMPDRVKWLINTLDKLISTEAKRNADPGKKSRIMEIAEWEVNPEFYEQLNRMYYNSSPDAFRDWVNKNGYYNKDGQIVPASFWKRLVPRKEYTDKYIDKVPDSSWIEMDKTSPYYNSNFDPSYGMSRVPKRSKYDNSANFNKLNKEEKALYDELFNTMIESNNMIVFKKHLNNGQLPQIEGGAWTLLNSQDTVLKGLGYMFKDRFAVKEDDPNAITDTTLDPDGTGIRLVPTRFMKKLDNPEALTNDLVGSIIAYYGMAVNFQEMSKIAPKMEMYLNMLANQEFKNWRGERIRGRESSTYAKAEEMIKQFVYGMEEQDSTININVSGKNVKINFNKILSDIAAFTRLNGMANNINVILTGLFTNKIQSRLDAISGIYYDNKALAKASKEVMLSYRHAIANIGNPNNKNKVLCALEWAGVVRDADTTFSKLNQSRWLRALNQHFWYGGYEIADYITKGKMAVAIMMSYKFDPETKKFVNKLTYMSRFKNKSEAEAKWDLLDTTAFDAFEMKNNMFTIKDEYVKYMDEVTANRIRNTIKQTGTRIDTQLTDLDKAYVSSNAYTKLLFIYRNFLLINLQTKFFTKRQYDYSTGMWQEAQYRGAFNYLWRHVLDKNKIKTLQEMYSNYDDLDEFERRLFKRSLYELIFSFVGLYVVSLVCKSLADDDTDNMFLQLMALVAVKVAIESRSNVSMIEATNMFTSPTAAWGIFQNFYKALTTIFDNPTEIVRSGAYKGKPRWFRSLVKITPFRAIYESKNFQEKRKYYDNMIAVF